MAGTKLAGGQPPPPGGVRECLKKGHGSCVQLRSPWLWARHRPPLFHYGWGCPDVDVDPNSTQREGDVKPTSAEQKNTWGQVFYPQLLR